MVFPGRRLRLATALLVAGLAPAGEGATLPPHRPLRILIVSDEVNPHGLADADLTQPGELSAALLDPGAGLALDPLADAVLEVPTDQIEQATARLSLARSDPAAYDVLVYFAHRIPAQGPDPGGRQDAFTAAAGAFLAAGGGLVSFHHGAYSWPGKAGILELIGATASGAVPWDTVVGQDVIDTAPGHFVTTNGMRYEGTRAYADPTLGVPAGTYGFFNNRPDERYPSFTRNPAAGDFEALFGSDYSDNGTTHLLGFVHRRPGWCGLVVGYQPGEYQPNALDLAGNNFQALANAIVYAAHARAADGILLLAAREPVAGAVGLEWTGGGAGFCVYRSLDEGRIVGRSEVIGSTAGRVWTDATPPGGRVVFYQVTGR